MIIMDTKIVRLMISRKNRAKEAPIKIINTVVDILLNPSFVLLSVFI
jgi:hypothetical protein